MAMMVVVLADLTRCSTRFLLGGVTAVQLSLALVRGRVRLHAFVKDTLSLCFDLPVVKNSRPRWVTTDGWMSARDTSFSVKDM